MIFLLPSLIFAYLLGAIPFGFLLSLIFAKLDIRKVGSNNIGSTNVFRSGHPILAVITLFLDSLKGYFAVIIIKNLLINNTHDIIFLNILPMVAIFAILGHIFSIWMKFKGGKGVATLIGVLLALNPYIGLVYLLLWATAFLLFRYSSLSAICAVALLPFYTLIIENDLFIYTIIMAIIILIKHKDNIIRLINKQEKKIKLPIRKK